MSGEKKTVPEHKDLLLAMPLTLIPDKAHLFVELLSTINHFHFEMRRQYETFRISISLIKACVEISLRKADA